MASIICVAAVTICVMARLGPATHVLRYVARKVVGSQAKPGHDTGAGTGAEP